MTIRNVVLLACVLGAAVACDTTQPEAEGAATVVVTPATPTLRDIGDTLRLTAVAKDPGGTVLTGLTFAWTSSDTTTVRVSADGLVTAVAGGAATIVAWVGTVSGATTVTVVRIASVVVTPADPTLGAIGDTVRLTAEARDSAGLVLARRTFTWRSGDTTKVRVSASGLVEAAGWGNAAVSATVDGITGLSFVSVWQPGAPATRLSAGWNYVCAAGRVPYCWGSDLMGQLGGFRVGRIPDGMQFSAISAGTGTTCGLDPAGVAYCWGDGKFGNLGNGRVFASSSTPVAVSGGLTFQAVSAQGDHSCGISTSGTAFCWGGDWDGELGAAPLLSTCFPGGVYACSPTPTQVTGSMRYRAISAAEHHTCALTTEGAAYCWGKNDRGQLGTADAIGRCYAYYPYAQPPDPGYACSRVPVATAGGLVFDAVSAGSDYTCGLAAGGSAYCWGANGAGQLGDGTTTDRVTPVPVSGNLTFQAIDAGESHTCGMAAGGAIYCWGSNSSGQIGDNTTTSRLTPVRVVGGFSFRAISAGSSFTCAFSTAWTVYCWGSNASGQLGDGTTTNRSSPVLAAGGIIFGTPAALDPARRARR